MRNPKYFIPIITVVLITFIPISALLLENSNALSKILFSNQKAFSVCNDVCNVTCGHTG